MLRPSRLAFAAAMLMLAACASDGDIAEAEDGCPRVGVLGEVGSVTRLSPGGEIASRASLGAFTGNCAISTGEVIVSVTVPVRGTQGSGGVPGKAESYEVFAAALDPAENPIAKQSAPVTLAFEQRMASGSVTLDIAIPLAAGRDPRDYRVALGFQLTEAELAFNRNPGAALR